jgi:hypothetical protein
LLNARWQKLWCGLGFKFGLFLFNCGQFTCCLNFKVFENERERVLFDRRVVCFREGFDRFGGLGEGFGFGGFGFVGGHD